MLAEIFMLKAEAAARAAKEPSTSQFVPITLPAAPRSRHPFQVFARPEPET